MAKFTFKNGKLMPSSEAAKVATEYQGKRKTQGEKAAAEKPVASKTLSVGNGSEKRG